MFVVDDLLNILKYLQGDTSIILDPKLVTYARNELGNSISYINNILIPVFNTPDTIRLFNFFVDWYAANKTLISVSRKATDVYALPDDHLDELISSFGFDNRDALRNMPKTTKPEFFKDLIELYKIKGTPQALFKVLEYFEVDLIGLYEYFLIKNGDGELVFRRSPLAQSIEYLDTGTLIDINFDDIVNSDPHWLLTKDQINSILARDGFGLPSKTPYLGVIPSIGFDKFIPYLAYISRYSQDKYYSGDTTTKDIITSIYVTVSYIELYTGLIYAFLRNYLPAGTHGNFICYDGTDNYTLTSITSLYNTFIGVRPTRENRNSTIDQLYDMFTRSESADFLTVEGGAEAYLTRINPAFKSEIDTYFDGNRGDEIVSSLLSDLINYYKYSIDNAYSPLGLFILDFAAFQKRFVNDVINFFKPYHARLQFVEKFISMGNRLEDSLPNEDSFEYPLETMEIFDFCTANGNSSFYDDTHLTKNYYSRQHFDTTALFDCGAVRDLFDSCIDIEEDFIDQLNFYPNDMTPFIENDYTLDGSDVIFTSSNSVSVNLDNNWITDAPFINDYFEVYVETIYNDLAIWLGMESSGGNLTVRNPGDLLGGSPTLTYLGSATPHNSVDTSLYKVGSSSNSHILNHGTGDYAGICFQNITTEWTAGKIGLYFYYTANFTDHAIKTFVQFQDTVTGSTLGITFGNISGLGPAIQLTLTLGANYVSAYALTHSLITNTWQFLEVSWDSSIYGWNIQFTLDNISQPLSHNAFAATIPSGTPTSLIVYSSLQFGRNTNPKVNIDNLMFTTNTSRDLYLLKDLIVAPI